tara:strand:- start:17819 stop:18595 length:777 start_codon:yes stop_codon:yes gene_type:complete
MKEDDVNDIFKDFEYKVEGKEETSKKETPKKVVTHDEELKERYKKAEKALKEEKIVEAPRRRIEIDKGPSSVERVAYIGIILVLAGFVAIDFSFFHNGGDSGVQDQAITAAAVKVENKTNESVEVEETVANVTVEEETQLSGSISLDIDNINSEVVDADDDLGYISKIIFTIENGKENNLTPVVDVFVYDSKMDESWELRSRGQYTGATIGSGEKQVGSVDVSPKTFRDLDIEKSIRLSLNSTEDGFITSVNENLVIS